MRKPLDTDDLLATLDDERHLGWGYAERRYLNVRTRHNADVVIVALANDAGWNYEKLFTWSNSKRGRWFCDHVGGRVLTQRAMRADANLTKLVTLKGM